MKSAEKTPKEIQSVQRAISILNCFDTRNNELSLADISDMLDLNKSTTYGILYTLYKYGYIAKNPKNGRYSLGIEFARKSLLVTNANSNKLEVAAIKYLKRLTAAYSVTSYLFAYQNSHLACLEMLIPGNSPYGSVSTVLGKKMAYHAAASGKVVIAHFTQPQLEQHLSKGPFFAFTEKTHTDPEEILQDIERTRRNGYSLEFEEVDIDIGAVSFPIYDMDAVLVGTISVSAQIDWFEKILDKLLVDLKEYSRLISDSFTAESQINERM